MNEKERKTFGETNVRVRDKERERVKMNILQHQNRDAFLGSSLISTPGDRLSPREMDDF